MSEPSLTPMMQQYRELKARDPSYAERVIFTTGQLVDDTVRNFLASTGRPCVPKPFEFTAFSRQTLRLSPLEIMRVDFFRYEAYSLFHIKRFWPTHRDLGENRDRICSSTRWEVDLL